MNEKAIRILEYNKIIELLEQQAGSEMTRKVISELKPFNDPETIKEGLLQTAEAAELIIYKGPLPLGNFYDIADSLGLAEKGGSLSPRQLLHILYNLKITRNTVNFLRGDLPPLPVLEGMAEALEIHRDLEEDIERCIISEDEISDNASSQLRSIRRKIVSQNETIKNRFDQILNSSENRTMLQDSIVTVRDGRYVIPVKQEHRMRFPGVIHDQSATGATVFIEPQVIVTMNNELTRMEAEERAEIERILSELSSRVAENHYSLSNNQKLLVEMDLISAKGRLAVMQKAEMPEISNDGLLMLKKARHPFIDKEKVVPVDVIVGGGYNALIITGPNTGGKTVTLKTVGLLSMMMQTGLHIPASSGSRMPVFRDIFADIGDEQSIEQNLSTFSSHMKNIVEITQNADEGSLVLLDELGAGTDPAEGAALAIAVIEDITGKNAELLATTHYTELKKYAVSADNVENASKEFDVETLSPTYRLIMGMPGKSNAFEISGKLGLSGGIIEKARTLLEGEDLRFEEVLSAIEADKKAAEAARDEAIAIDTEMKKQKEAMDLERKKLTEQKEKTLNEARTQARSIIKEASETSEDVKEELRKIAKMESLGERTRHYEESRRRIKDAAGRYRERIIREENDDPVKIEEIKAGDRVKVLTLGRTGEILSLPDNRDEVMVQVGGIKVRASVSDLKIVNDGGRRKKKKAERNYGSLYNAKARSVSPSVDVRGQNLDEALADVDKYLDDAFMGGLRNVTIIHGRGEGILKKGIRDLLKKHKNVSEFRPGTYNEGGDGVSIVTLK